MSVSYLFNHPWNIKFKYLNVSYSYVLRRIHKQTNNRKMVLIASEKLTNACSKFVWLLARFVCKWKWIRIRCVECFYYPSLVTFRCFFLLVSSFFRSFSRLHTMDVRFFLLALVDIIWTSPPNTKYDKVCCSPTDQ